MPLLWNVVMAVVWAAAMGKLSVANLGVGFMLGYAVLYLACDVLGTRKYCGRLPRIGELLLFFLWEVLVANLRVARSVLSPSFRMRPGIIALPLDVETDGEITMLANLITLTPGTVSLDVSPDRKLLYVHAMYIDDEEQLKRRLKQGFERRLLGVLR
jgi:multicomponent Na+:H+ antiporter subunit E